MPSKKAKPKKAKEEEVVEHEKADNEAEMEQKIGRIREDTASALVISKEIERIEKKMDKETMPEKEMDKLQDTLDRLGSRVTVRFLMKPKNQVFRPIILDIDYDAKPDQKWLIIEDVSGEPKVIDLWMAAERNETVPSHQKFNMDGCDKAFYQLVGLIKGKEIEGLDGKIVTFNGKKLEIYDNAERFKESVK